MKGKIHKDMTYQVLSDFPKKSVLNFLIKGTAKKAWKTKPERKKIWLKEWMDAPDLKDHNAVTNDHSYKLEKTDEGFKLRFIDDKSDQATVIARLKYDSRDVKEWQFEGEYRSAAIELAKSIHWVVDFNSPPHTVKAFSTEEHAYLETHFDKVWEKHYNPKELKFTGKSKIKDIYKWAKDFVEAKYDRNYRLLELVREKGDLNSGEGEQLVKDVLKDLAQNLIEYIKYMDAKIHFDEIVKKV